MRENLRLARESQPRVNIDRAEQLELWGGDATGEGWSIRESARARRLTMRVFRSGRVEVIVPLRTSRRMLERFIHDHREWVQRKRAAARAEARPIEPFPPTEIALAASAERFRLHLAGGHGRLRASGIDSSVLRLSGAGATRAEFERVLRAWLVERSREHLGRLLAAVAAQFGFEYTRLSVRCQRTRWGSCSTRGTISLNCCLMFQRPEVVRYLVIHELAHTRHMNHSARFWSSVAACCPGYEALDRELLEGWRRVPAWVFGGD